MVRIKRKEDLPTWLYIKNYDATKNFTARDWYQQLFVRKFCQEIGNEDSFVKQVISAIRENPIIDVINDDRFSLIKGYSAFANNISFIPGIHQMTAHEFVAIEKDIDPIKHELARKWSKQNHLNPQILYSPEIDFPINELNPNFKKFIAISINSNLPKPLLMKQFEEILDSLQIKNGRDSEKRYQQLDFRSWYKYGVLPYLDLDVWQNEVNKSITNLVFANAIHAAEVRGEENIRKTTAHLAKTLLSYESLNELAGQAYIEMIK